MAVVEQVKSFEFLGVHIAKELSRSTHTYTVVKRMQQRLFPLRRLKRFGMGHQILKKFYSCTSEIILTGCKDSSHPRYILFFLLPHSKQYQRTKAGTNRTLNSLYPKP